MRRSDREITDEKKIAEILDTAKILHLGMVDGDRPYVLPLHYGYEFRDGALVFYMHGAKEGRKLEILRASPAVCVELESGVELVSGGDVPCRYGSLYASLIAEGKAELVEDTDEKLRALALLMQNQTGRSFPFDRAMADSVAVIKVTAQSYTAKGRLV